MVREAGTAIIPALRIRMSRRGRLGRKGLMARGIVEREVWSSFRNVVWREGCFVLRVLRTVSARGWERPVNIMWAGLWSARRRIVWSPRPAVPTEMLLDFRR